MTNSHRATPEQWASPPDLAHQRNAICIIDRRILELRARVEALERMATTRSFGIDTSRWSDEQRQQFLGEISEPGAVEQFTDPRLGEPWMVRADGIQHGPAMPAPVPADLIPADCLVERVARAIGNSERTIPETGSAWTPEARAAIREVAAWLESEAGKFQWRHEPDGWFTAVEALRDEIGEAAK